MSSLSCLRSVDNYVVDVPVSGGSARYYASGAIYRNDGALTFAPSWIAIEGATKNQRDHLSEEIRGLIEEEVCKMVMDEVAS